MLMAASLPQIGVWYSNRTLAMNATTLDINLSQTLANKTLVVTTILVSGPRQGWPFPESCPNPVPARGVPRHRQHADQQGM